MRTTLIFPLTRWYRSVSNVHCTYWYIYTVYVCVDTVALVSSMCMKLLSKYHTFRQACGQFIRYTPSAHVYNVGRGVNVVGVNIMFPFFGLLNSKHVHSLF